MDRNLLIESFKKMLLIRIVEESLVKYIENGNIKTPVHLYTGQESIAVGVCANLNKNDYVFGNHRSHGHYLAKGGNLKAMIAEIFCKESGCSKGRGGSMHLIDPDNGVLGIVPIVAGTISLALGAALSSKIQHKKEVTVSFFGDGATGEGVLYESMNFAALKKLPIIFACENNLYSTHLPLKEIRANKEIYKSAFPFGVKGYRVDGNDLFKVYEKAREAVEICRNGEGPIFIEFLTYRMRGHVGPDDNIQGNRTDIRPREEIEFWEKKDAINKVERAIIKNGIQSQNEIVILKKKIENEVESAITNVINSEFPNPNKLLNYVYK